MIISGRFSSVKDSQIRFCGGGGRFEKLMENIERENYGNYIF